MPLDIRVARLGDALDIATAHHAAVHAIASGYAPEVLANWAPPVNLGRAEQLYREGQALGEIALVAEMDGAVIGFAIAYLPNSELRACYVAPVGSGRGIGRALCTGLEDAARAAGCTHLDVRASTNAVPFYRVLGYAETARGHSTFGDGTRMPVVFMRKVL
jgi:GNAT superfamily N-acetyltransferase